MSQDVAAKRSGLTVKFYVGDPAGRAKFAKNLSEQMRLYERTSYGRMSLRDQRRYADWTPARLLDHLATTRQDRTARPGARRRRTTRARRARSPTRSQPDEPPLSRFPARIPAARLVPLIQGRLETGCSIRELAQIAGVPERRVRSILDGDQANVSWTVADALVTRALGGPFLWIGDGPLADLYGVAA